MEERCAEPRFMCFGIYVWVSDLVRLFRHEMLNGVLDCFAVFLSERRMRMCL